MKLGIISDEMSKDFATAVEMGTSWGIRNYELRGLPSGRVPMVSESDVESVLRVKEETGITISSLSPGLFKRLHDDEEVEERIRTGIPRACDLAHKFGTDALVDFVFSKPGSTRQEMAAAEGAAWPPQVIDLLGRIADAVAAGGCRLYIENESVCWGDTGARTAAIVRQLNRPNVSINWDPGNAFNSGETPYPDGYAAVKDLVAHVHVKDYAAVRGAAVPAGEGSIDWTGQIRALIEHGYSGYVVVETHFRPRIEGSRRAVEALRNIICAVA